MSAVTPRSDRTDAAGRARRLFLGHRSVNVDLIQQAVVYPYPEVGNKDIGGGHGADDALDVALVT